MTSWSQVACAVFFEMSKPAGSADSPKFPLRIADEGLRRRLRKVAEAEGESLNTWIVEACIQRLDRKGLADLPPDSAEAAVFGREMAEHFAAVEGTPEEEVLRQLGRTAAALARSHKARARLERERRSA